MFNTYGAAYKMNEALTNGGCIAIRAKEAPNITMDCDHLRGIVSFYGRFEDFAIIERTPPMLPKIERVIFNPPATIVFWDDKTKTVVKCSECEASPRPDCAMKIHYGACFRESDMRFLLPYMDAQAEEEWKLRGIIAAMLKKAWGNVAPSMIAEALAAADWNGGADD